MKEEKVKEYVKTQLEYDYKSDIHPTNTQAMVHISHNKTVNAVKRFSRLNKVHLLDIGCGWGDFSEKLDPYIEDYIGVDPSIIELERFVKKKKDNRFLIRGFGENLDFIKDNSRNLILLNSVLDHCYDWQKTLGNCYRILSSNGYLIIAMENADKLPVRLKKIFGIHAEHHGHLSYLTGEDLESNLSNNYYLLERNTSGFLFGFHYLTKLIPIPVKILVFINKIFDAVAKLIFPFSGHMLFYVIKSNKNDEKMNFKNPFRCPSCSNEITFGNKECSNCKFKFDFISDNILDTTIKN
ncbi:MAG: hypothetical protein A2068_06415 [Ignavibacteria bacterium GWB2_35_6b]|nr:MAG: hypothetical protein A2068_06415 [Ignavibacteria bacterium GWB2_35_6b]